MMIYVIIENDSGEKLILTKRNQCSLSGTILYLQERPNFERGGNFYRKYRPWEGNEPRGGGGEEKI